MLDLIVVCEVYNCPNKRIPELTKDLFWKVATSSLAKSRHHATALYIRIESEDDSFNVTDGWKKNNSQQPEGPRLRYDEKSFSQEMAGRLKQIAKLACGHEPGDW